MDFDQSSGLPEPAPEIIMALNGVYWRRYPEFWSMVPTSDDNDPVLTPYTVYKPLATEDHEGQRHFLPDVIERIAHVIETAECAPSLATPRAIAMGVARALLDGASDEERR